MTIVNPKFREEWTNSLNRKSAVRLSEMLETPDDGSECELLSFEEAEAFVNSVISTYDRMLEDFVAPRVKADIQLRILELEDRDDPENDAYLDEGEQAELSTLYWVMGDDNY